MKKLLFIMITLFFSHSIFSQSVNGLDLIELEQEYIGVQCWATGISNFRVLVDFGQKTKLNVIKNRELLDEDGDAIRVNSPIEALNILHKYGYEVVEVYDDEDSDDHHREYLLKRREGFDGRY